MHTDLMAAPMESVFYIILFSTTTSPKHTSFSKNIKTLSQSQIITWQHQWSLFWVQEAMVVVTYCKLIKIEGKIQT